MCAQKAVLGGCGTSGQAPHKRRRWAGWQTGAGCQAATPQQQRQRGGTCCDRPPRARPPPPPLRLPRQMHAHLSCIPQPPSPSCRSRIALALTHPITTLLSLPRFLLTLTPPLTPTPTPPPCRLLKEYGDSVLGQVEGLMPAVGKLLDKGRFPGGGVEGMGVGGRRGARWEQHRRACRTACSKWGGVAVHGVGSQGPGGLSRHV